MPFDLALLHDPRGFGHQGDCSVSAVTQKLYIRCGSLASRTTPASVTLPSTSISSPITFTIGIHLPASPLVEDTSLAVNLVPLPFVFLDFALFHHEARICSMACFSSSASSSS
jgi:hypothetical protein